MKNPHATTMARASLAAILAGCAASTVETNPVVPENLKVPVAQVLSLVSPATGVQIYECSAGQNRSDAVRVGLQGPGSRLVRPFREEDRQTLCRSDLGIERWKQSGRRSQSARRRSGRHRNPVAVAERKIDCGERRLQPDTGNSAAVHRRRESSRGGLQPGAAGQGGPGPLQGYLLLLRRQAMRACGRPRVSRLPPLNSVIVARL